MAQPAVSLDDKYTLREGRAYLSGTQALVRLPIIQKQRDLAAGLNTGGFISGYRGSPLGGYDQALWQAKKFLSAENIIFQPGLNEDIAATSVWGSQQVNLAEGANVDGVFAIWYGKAPGVDRSLDALKHANSAGTAAFGGVLALMGDDHGGVSSTLVSQTEQVMISAMIPVVNPASVQEYIDFGLLGFALSRYSGCWVGFKAISETIESSASVVLDPERVQIVVPTDFEMPEGGLGIRTPDPLVEQEIRLHGPKMDAIAAFARANRFDWTVWGSPVARIGIVTTGKAYLDVRQALSDLGLDEARARQMGVTLYKVGLTWPLETEGLRRFANGLEQIIVVEEKRALIEDQIVKALYNEATRPIVVGKKDEGGRVLFPSEGELNPVMVARALGARLALSLDDPILRQNLARIEDEAGKAATPPAALTRTPYFCSGCPHNTSTNVPTGSRAGAGIGCHGMASFIPERRTTNITHMGGEGANWIGHAPFTSENHVFQNLGDGTYYHSGLLAIRAAAASGVNITYKILFNDAVAMTGGQPHDGPLTAPLITQQVAAEGAKQIVVVTDEPDKYGSDAGFAPGVTIRHRDDLDAVQRELRDVPGMTVLVYDQACAAEKRRKRKRNLYPDPPKRVFINDRVCEGCGDCSEKSNCVAVKPLETDYGRKRRIDQSDCNKDFSCLNGFCPSFVTVHGGAVRKAKPTSAAVGGDPFAGLPSPVPASLGDRYQILVTGIGGTGVITVGALIGMAAHIEGKGCTVLDNTGFAQKNGAVMSHITLSPEPEDPHAVRIAAGEADVLIGCDIVVASGASALSRLRAGVTRAIINDQIQPTSDFVRNNNIDFKGAGMRRSLQMAIGEGVEFVNATGLATALLGDAIATNLFMLGYAWQKGLIPLEFGSIDRAIELNGVAVDANRRTFAWGRLAAHDRGAVEAIARPSLRAEPPVDQSLSGLTQRRSEDLVAYQGPAYATRYRALVDAAARADERAGGGGAFALSVARNFYKAMAYKDEYEVARLHSDPAFRAQLDQQFEGDYRLQFHLAPPLLARRNPATGELIKQTYGPWMLRAFGILARLKGLRGTWADPFGRTHERREERALVAEYEAMISSVAERLTPSNFGIAVELAEIPAMVRGYGHIKERHLAAARARRADLLAQFETAAPSEAAA